MKILENHILTFTNGSANNKTKTGGYGYVIKNYNVSQLIPRSAKTKTNNQKMEIQALIEVFQNIEVRNNPILMFVTSDYVYNCIKGKSRNRANRDQWKKLQSLINDFENKGGTFRIYLIKSKLRTTVKDIEKGLKLFKSKNDQLDIEYLKRYTKISMRELFKEIIRCFMFAHEDAVVGMKNCKI
jgi:ribonuclease HI